MNIPKKVRSRIRQAGYIPVSRTTWNIFGEGDEMWAAKYYLEKSTQTPVLITVGSFTGGFTIEVLTHKSYIAL